MTEPPLPQAPTPQIEPASEWSQAVNRSGSENFSVMSLLVPRIHRAHFAAVYAFCRVADDLADQTGSGPAARARSLELLARFRHEFTQTCQEHRPPAQPQWSELFARLAATMSECSLPLRPFHALLDAFEQDQRCTRYDSWDELVRYSQRSANPVGHLVLMIFGYRPPDEAPSNPEMYLASDDICTALQLINFWQDVRRDLLERDRIYLPLAQIGLTQEQLLTWMNGPINPQFGRAILPLVDRTASLFASGSRLFPMLATPHRHVIRLFSRGGQAIVSKVRSIHGATLWQRPRLPAWEKAWLLARELFSR